MVPESFASYMTTMHLSQNVISFIWPEKFAHGRVKGKPFQLLEEKSFFLLRIRVLHYHKRAAKYNTLFHVPTILSLPKLVIALS